MGTKKTAAKVSSKKARSKKASSKKVGDSDAVAASGQQWNFPKLTLEESIVVPRAIEDKNAGNPMSGSVLVKAVGFNQTNDWRYRDLLKSSSLYGMTDGTPSKEVRLLQIGMDIVAPSSPSQRQNALLSAFRKVDKFRQVEEFYSGKKIPEGEYFENNLTREFGIPRERVETFTRVFMENLKFLKLFDAQRVASADSTVMVEDNSPSLVSQVTDGAVSRVREFLDTCFVMMPFGGYFDTYYRDIYVPSIRDAGFEPVRADELFSTGSVVEQIWEQVRKSRVLLADLTGKNANVFYELGLAHAAYKPVVFTSGNLNDVPFDLRHLRVIIYDVNQPDWATSLRRNVAEYLKNARQEPNKSIPQPFRDLAGHEERHE